MIRAPGFERSREPWENIQNRDQNPERVSIKRNPFRVVRDGMIQPQGSSVRENPGKIFKIATKTLKGFQLRGTLSGLYETE